MFDELTLLRLLQLTDSALPIGTTAHSFGLESMIADGFVTPCNFEQYLRDYMQESGKKRRPQIPAGKPGSQSYFGPAISPPRG